MPWESPAPAPCPAPWVCLWQSWRWARGGHHPALVTSLGMGLQPAQLCSLCPPCPPLLLYPADSLEAGSAAGVSRRPSQGCPQEGKVRHLFSLFYHNSLCGLIEMLHRAAAFRASPAGVSQLSSTGSLVSVDLSWAGGAQVLAVLLSSLRCI